MERTDVVMALTYEPMTDSPAADPGDAQCHGCGDTGWYEPDGHPCDCRAGVERFPSVELVDGRWSW
jgi:hypothetical protein